MNSFLSTNRESATAFLTAISTSMTKAPTPYSPSLSLTGESIAALEATLPPLHGQSIAIPTRPRDLPREYALFAASITAAAKDRMSDPPVTPTASTSGVPLHRPSTAGSDRRPTVRPSQAAVPEEWETVKSRCLMVQRQIDTRLRKVAKESRRGTSAGGRTASSSGRASTPSDRPPKSPSGYGYHLPTRLGGGGYDENVPPQQTRPSTEGGRDPASTPKLTIRTGPSSTYQDPPMVSLARDGGVLVPIENHALLGSHAHALHPSLQHLFIPNKYAQRPSQGYDNSLSRPRSREKDSAEDDGMPKTPRRRFRTEPSPTTMLSHSDPTTPINSNSRQGVTFCAAEGEAPEQQGPAELELPPQEVKKRPSKGFLSRLTGRG
ncbi:hypothetical protein CALCODRAFT_15389 [Calocera cornea HHB12733]|uniref:Uncharacterized protein n=1 Tax=Calocera cornea HHB12733 TaxID=1353952 RepID=A0A165E9W6_9BASI|nr:hypothetical protein CALCODRAFT_15389 [Calocera cornea HHB12733]